MPDFKFYKNDSLAHLAWLGKAVTLVRKWNRNEEMAGIVLHHML
jgi:hypothetical protein